MDLQQLEDFDIDSLLDADWLAAAGDGETGVALYQFDGRYILCSSLGYTSEIYQVVDFNESDSPYELVAEVVREYLTDTCMLTGLDLHIEELRFGIFEEDEDCNECVIVATNESGTRFAYFVEDRGEEQSILPRFYFSDDVHDAFRFVSFDEAATAGGCLTDYSKYTYYIVPVQ